MKKSACCSADDFDLLSGKTLRRFAFVNHLNIAAFAEAFAAGLRAREVPRDPFLLLPYHGIRLERTRLSRATRALWVRTDNLYSIHYSQYEPRAAVRFSLWHELFEILAAHPDFPSVLSPNWKERLADRFAAAILMPQWAVRREAEKFATNGAGLSAVLADRFGVSLSAMRRRLREVAADTAPRRIVRSPAHYASVC